MWVSTKKVIYVTFTLGVKKNKKQKKKPAGTLSWEKKEHTQTRKHKRVTVELLHLLHL